MTTTARTTALPPRERWATAHRRPLEPSKPTTERDESSGHQRLAETERIGDEIARLAAHIHAATYHLLVLIADFDARDGWGGGFRSCAHWLNWRIGIGLGAARERVRVARALRSLPDISAAMERGSLSFSKVRALTRVATPENERDLMDFALHGTASRVERLVRAWRRVDAAEEADAERARHDRRGLELYPDTDGSWVLRGRLDPEVGEVLRAALDAAVTELHGRAPAPEESTPRQRRADAVGLVAELALQAPSGGEDVPAGTSRAGRYQVVMHVDGEGQAVWERSGWRVPAETSRRISCDSGLVEMQENAAGETLDVGRRRRTVPTAVRRALERRDRGCRFPGCSLRYTDAHHVRHWADGGTTALDNLVLLCRRHHRAVHEGGFRVEMAEGAPRFYRPDGRALPDAPAAPQLPAAATADPVGALAALTPGRGRAIDAWTATPDWHGERLDMGWAIDVLWRPRCTARDPG